MLKTQPVNSALESKDWGRVSGCDASLHIPGCEASDLVFWGLRRVRRCDCHLSPLTTKSKQQLQGAIL